ncbi:MAG: hypothetical protein IJZ53_07530 [Tyzzerella sp.]|nr:hypothetical protein [Tyzzerella sp.]
MCYDCLSMLNDIIDENKINKLREYFISLTPNSRGLITVSKIASFLQISNETAVQVILKCEEAGILRRHFGIRCPNCGMLIKEISTPSVDEIYINECYCCDGEINISENDVVILFELVKLEIPFDEGQQSGQVVSNEASIVAQEDTLKAFKIMCEMITESVQEKRLKEYQIQINNQKRNEIHRKAVKKANKNRIINIIANIVSVIIAVVIICLIYKKFGFAKLSLFVSFFAFIIPFGCNFIVKELFLIDIARVEEKLLLKENE